MLKTSRVPGAEEHPKQCVTTKWKKFVIGEEYTKLKAFCLQ
jgi:hypothetical protein